MPVANVNERLIELFNSFFEATQFKSKSELLAKAKMVVFNDMSDQELVGFFAKDQNLENLFQLDCWTPSEREEDEENEKPGDAQSGKYYEQYDIVQKLLACFKSHEELFADTFRAHLFYLVQQDKDEKVKHLTLDCLIKLSNEFYKSYPKESANRDEIERNLNELLPVLVKQIPKTTVSFSQKVSRYLANLTNPKRVDDDDGGGKPIYSLEAFESNAQLINEFKSVLGQRSMVTCLRGFEVIVELATVSEQHLALICERKFGLSALIDKHVLDDKSASRDVLSQLNCIEFLIDLARTEHGYRYLQSRGYLANLIAYLSDAELEANPFASLLVPTIVKLFSNIARSRPAEVHLHFPQYYAYLFKSAVDDDLVNRQLTINLAIETLIYLFESNLFKKFLLDTYRARFVELLSRLVWLVKNSVNDKLKTNVFVCVSHIVCADPDLLLSNELLKEDAKLLADSLSVRQESTWCQLAHELYTIMLAAGDMTHERLFSVFLGFAKKPFVDLRLAAHLYFKALMQTRFGLEYLFTPNKFNGRLDFIDGYLLSRATELEKEGLESKYEMMKLLVASLAMNQDLATRLLGEPVLAKLNEYAKQGPYFATAQSRVAFESN